MTNAVQNCKHCQKSSLSLLLLRPSPVAWTPGCALWVPHR